MSSLLVRDADSSSRCSRASRLLRASRALCAPCTAAAAASVTAIAIAISRGPGRRPDVGSSIETKPIRWPSFARMGIRSSSSSSQRSGWSGRSSRGITALTPPRSDSSIAPAGMK